MKNILFKISLVLFFVVGCKSARKSDQNVIVPTKDDMINVNRYLVEQDAKTIGQFVEQKGWSMQSSKAGYWYDIYEKGTGKQVQFGSKITLKYQLHLIDGTLCYSSDSTGYKEFVVGKGEVESGLQQAVMILKQGDKARFIFPPQLAYGLVGDRNCIPARSIIIYHVDVLSVE